MSLLNKIKGKSHKDDIKNLNTIESLIKEVEYQGDLAYVAMARRMGISIPTTSTQPSTSIGGFSMGMGMGMMGMIGGKSDWGVSQLPEDRGYIDKRLEELSNNKYFMPTTLQEANEWLYRIGFTNYNFEETNEKQIIYINKETKQVLFISDSLEELIVPMVVSDRFRAVSNLPRCDWKLPDSDTVNKILDQTKRGNRLLADVETYYDIDKRIYYHGINGVLKLQSKETQEKPYKVISGTVYINIGPGLNETVICDKSGKIKTDIMIEDEWAPIEPNEYVVTYDHVEESELFIAKFRGINNIGQAIFEISNYSCSEARLNTTVMKVQFNKLSKAVEYVYKKFHEI